MVKHLRALGRLAKIVSAIGKATWRVTAQKPDDAELTRIQQKLYKDIKNIMSLNVELNETQAKLETKRPAWYLANHTSYGDIVVMGASIRGVFSGKGEILTWPLVRYVARAANYIGLRRHRKYNPQSRAKLINNFNAGNNAVTFPEATIPGPEPDRGVVTGDEVYMFHAGLLSIVFNEAGEDKKGNRVELDAEIAKNLCVQGMAIKVKEVDGQEGAHENRDLRQVYTGHNKGNMLTQLWQLLGTKEMTVELTPLPIVQAKDFPDHFTLANEVQRRIASIVSPDQEIVYPALLPGQDPETRGSPRPMPPPYDKDNTLAVITALKPAKKDIKPE